MSAQTANLFLLEDLEEISRTRGLAESDLDALRAVADWFKTFVARPHKDLGRAGTVCPFVPGALERKTLWLAPEHIADQDVQGVVELMSSYKSLFLDAQPTDGDDASYKVVVVVFTDLSADRAQGVFGDVLQQLAVPAYAEDGILFGPFYEGNEGTANLQLRLPTIPIARAVSVREARSHQRLEVLPGQRGLALTLGASLWRVRSSGSC
jgi:hypothetical protein